MFEPYAILAIGIRKGSSISSFAKALFEQVFRQIAVCPPLSAECLRIPEDP
jgi:hypothetical protein